MKITSSHEHDLTALRRARMQLRFQFLIPDLNRDRSNRREFFSRNWNSQHGIEQETQVRQPNSGPISHKTNNRRQSLLLTIQTMTDKESSSITIGNECPHKYYKLSSSSSDRKKLDTMIFYKDPRFLTIPLRLQHQLRILRCFCAGSRLIEVPDSIGNLKNLRELNLWECVKIESLPPSIGKLKNLEILDLTNTRILELPKEIGNLENLREFHLTRCRRIKTLPSSIGRLKKLEKLLLPRSWITHLPNEIGELSNLLVLSLDHCMRLESLPASLGQLSKLERLEVDITKLLWSSQEIGKLENLRWLSVSWQLFGPKKFSALVKQFLIKSIKSCPRLGTISAICVQDDIGVYLKMEDLLCLQLHLALNRARNIPEKVWPLLISKPIPIRSYDYHDGYILYVQSEYWPYYSSVNREVVYRALVEGSMLFSLAISREQRKSQPKPNENKGN